MPQHNRSTVTNPLRRKLSQMIHIGKSKLGLDEETYRDMLRAHGGASSTTEMDVAQLERVLAHMKSAGFKAVPAKSRKTPHNLGKGDKGDLMKKIEALLTDAGKPWGYAIAMARRMYKKERVEFCDANELAGIVAALDRAAIKRLVPELLSELVNIGMNFRHARFIAFHEFNFDANSRDITRYPEAMSKVLRFLRGELVGTGKCKVPVKADG